MKRWKFDHKRSVRICRDRTGAVCLRTAPRYYEITEIFRISGYDMDLNEGSFVVQYEDTRVIGRGGA